MVGTRVTKSLLETVCFIFGYQCSRKRRAKTELIMSVFRGTTIFVVLALIMRTIAFPNFYGSSHSIFVLPSCPCNFSNTFAFA